jgi:hypothetical protein
MSQWQQEQVIKTQYSFRRWVENILSTIIDIVIDIGKTVGRLAKRLWIALFG